MFCITIKNSKGNPLEEENIRDREIAYRWKRDVETLLAQIGEFTVTIREHEEKRRSPVDVAETLLQEQKFVA